MKVKRSELTNLLQGINSINLTGVKFNYALLKNKKKIQEELETLKTVIKPDKKVEEFEKARIELCKEYCENDKNGKEIIKQGKFVGLENNKAFTIAIDKLKETYKETLDKKDAQVKEYYKLLEEEVEIEMHQVALNEVPKEITTKQLESILVIIKE